MALYQRVRIWYADFYINGQRVQTSTGTPNKREAERFMAKQPGCWRYSQAGQNFA